MQLGDLLPANYSKIPIAIKSFDQELQLELATT